MEAKQKEPLSCKEGQEGRGPSTHLSTSALLNKSPLVSTLRRQPVEGNMDNNDEPKRKTFLQAVASNREVQKQNGLTSLREFGTLEEKKKNPWIKEVGEKDGKACINITAEEMKILKKELSNVVVAKFQTKRPELSTFYKFLKSSCPTLDFRVSAMNILNILITFESEEAANNLLQYQGLNFNGGGVRFFRWTQDIHRNHDPPQELIWLCLPKIPLHVMKKKEILYSIASACGTPIAMDEATANCTRPSAARIQVKVDLLKPQKTKIWVGSDEEGFWQNIIFESWPSYCSHCRKKGHSLEECFVKNPRFQRKQGRECRLVTDSVPTQNPTLPLNSKDKEETGEFKWVEVRRKKKFSGRDNNNDGMPAFVTPSRRASENRHRNREFKLQTGQLPKANVEEGSEVRLELPREQDLQQEAEDSRSEALSQKRKEMMAKQTTTPKGRPSYLEMGEEVINWARNWLKNRFTKGQKSPRLVGNLEELLHNNGSNEKTNIELVEELKSPVLNEVMVRPTEEATSPKLLFESEQARLPGNQISESPAQKENKFSPAQDKSTPIENEGCTPIMVKPKQRWGDVEDDSGAEADDEVQETNLHGKTMQSTQTLTPQSTLHTTGMSSPSNEIQLIEDVGLLSLVQQKEDGDLNGGRQCEKLVVQQIESKSEKEVRTERDKNSFARRVSSRKTKGNRYKLFLAKANNEIDMEREEEEGEASTNIGGQTMNKEQIIGNESLAEKIGIHVKRSQ